VNGHMQPAVFLDRDGVINQAIVREGKPYPPASLEEVVLLPGARQAFQSLRQAGFRLIAVSNQPDVARGTQTRAAVEAINAYLLAQLPIDEVLVCYHDNNDHCDCRKPKPGLILRAAEKYQIDLRQSYLVGDRMKDIEAGYRAGCKTVFIDYDYAEDKTSASPDKTVRTILEASEWILSDTTSPDKGDHPTE
jgi:D-glycero-D-manno-heptose 1,7-bisphosphate phosphatase